VFDRLRKNMGKVQRFTRFQCVVENGGKQYLGCGMSG
jgi:hypothetical protein